ASRKGITMTASTVQPAAPAARASAVQRAGHAVRGPLLRVGAAFATGALILTASSAAATAAPPPGPGSLQSVAAPEPPDPPPGPPSAGTTTVSLTFDDGNADQMTTVDTLGRYGLLGTFFIVSGYVGHDG